MQKSNQTKERNKLTQPLLELRKELVYFAWETYKNQITMEELAKVFGTPLGSIYNYLKEKHKEYEEHKSPNS